MRGEGRRKEEHGRAGSDEQEEEECKVKVEERKNTEELEVITKIKGVRGEGRTEEQGRAGRDYQE